jgi:putative radical SAM enzyme (TIGR03279 family)
MSVPRVVAVDAASPAFRAGLRPGDELAALNGRVPRDIIQYQLLADEPELDLDVRRGGLELTLRVEKAAGEPLGIEIHSPVFDQVRTCDNHCEFCFIYQLPKGLRPSLYVKDDDYRLSFLYGNFTTLTRFTEADLERVVEERLSPLFVSIHATDPEVRATMLRNRRGATSLRWLRALLDHGIEVHGQVVCCPGANDGEVLHDTLAGVLDQYPELETAAVVPLGVSRYTAEPGLRAHTRDEAAAVVDTVEEWQQVFLSAFGRRVVFAADEYYLLAERPFPGAESYEGFPQHENGIGIARAFEQALLGESSTAPGVRPGFFASVDGAPASGYRGPRAGATTGVARLGGLAGPGSREPGAEPPLAILTGEYGAEVIEPLLTRLGRPDVRVVPVRNEFFGGNIAVAGLLSGADVARALAADEVAGEPGGRPHATYLLPDVCLSQGRFLDGLSLSDLPRPVEVVATDGLSLRRVLLGTQPGAGARTPAGTGR